MSYTLGDMERHTTGLLALGSNDIYMWAPDWHIINGGPWNYGGVTDADVFGDRYVFAVPRQAENFVLEITDMPPLELPKYRWTTLGLSGPSQRPPGSSAAGRLRFQATPPQRVWSCSTI